MKDIIKTFTVKMSSTMAKRVKKTFDIETKEIDGGSYMLAFQPIAESGELRVHILSERFGSKMQQFINKHKRKE